MTPKTLDQHIAITPGVAGGRPRIAGHRITVQNIAPLEIVSARGRALPLFGFEYLWEVYKPAAQRRWGYYTLPVLYGDRLVARLDPRLDRATGTLYVNGFWLEPETVVDTAFVAALAAGFARFLRFTRATAVTLPAGIPPAIAEGVGAL